MSFLSRVRSVLLLGSHVDGEAPELYSDDTAALWVRLGLHLVRAAAPPGTARAEPSIDPATGGLLVALAGGAGSQTAPSVVVDQGVLLVGAGTVNCTTAAHLTALTGGGYIIVTNLDPTVAIYLGGASVSGGTNGEALPAGQARSWRSADLTLEYGIGSAAVNVSVRR